MRADSMMTPPQPGFIFYDNSNGSDCEEIHCDLETKIQQEEPFTGKQSSHKWSAGF